MDNKQDYLIHIIQSSRESAIVYIIHLFICDLKLSKIKLLIGFAFLDPKMSTGGTLLLITIFLLLQGSMRDGSGEVSPKDTKTSDLMSEADSNDGLASG